MAFRRRAIGVGRLSSGPMHSSEDIPLQGFKPRLGGDDECCLRCLSLEALMPCCLVPLLSSLCFLFGFPYFSRSTSWTSTRSVRRYPRMMASVNQLALALASSTQELTLALANLRFDFTLFKFEAPAEFAALGAALTPARRESSRKWRMSHHGSKTWVSFRRYPPSSSSPCQGLRHSLIRDRGV